MDKYNAVICSYKVFQETLGMGQATVARCVKYLKDHGFLYVYKTGTSNVYVANKNLVWNSWGIMSNIANFQQILFYLHQSKKNVLKCVINVSRQYRKFCCCRIWWYIIYLSLFYYAAVLNPLLTVGAENTSNLLQPEF